MLILNLSNDPNQSFSIQLDTHQYNFILKSINTNNTPGVGIMAVDIIRDNIPIVLGNRCMPFFPLIPYLYLENTEGNFSFFTLNNDYPDYTQFGITQFLAYLSPEDLEALRAGT
jgi:uncharacterized protein DUF6983